MLTLPMDHGVHVDPSQKAIVRIWFRDAGLNGATDFLGNHDVTPVSNPTPYSLVDLTANLGNATWGSQDTIRVSITPKRFHLGVHIGYGVTRNLLWGSNGAGEVNPELNLEPFFYHRTNSGGQGGNATGSRTGGGQNDPPTTPPPGG